MSPRISSAPPSRTSTAVISPIGYLVDDVRGALLDEDTGRYAFGGVDVLLAVAEGKGVGIILFSCLARPGPHVLYILISLTRCHMRCHFQKP